MKKATFGRIKSLPSARRTGIVNAMPEAGTERKEDQIPVPPGEFPGSENGVGVGEVPLIRNSEEAAPGTEIELDIRSAEPEHVSTPTVSVERTERGERPLGERIRGAFAAAFRRKPIALGLQADIQGELAEAERNPEPTQEEPMVPSPSRRAVAVLAKKQERSPEERERGEVMERLQYARESMVQVEVLFDGKIDTLNQSQFVAGSEERGDKRWSKQATKQWFEAQYDSIIRPAWSKAAILPGDKNQAQLAGVLSEEDARKVAVGEAGTFPAENHWTPGDHARIRRAQFEQALALRVSDPKLRNEMWVREAAKVDYQNTQVEAARRLRNLDLGKLEAHMGEYAAAHPGVDQEEAEREKERFAFECETKAALEAMVKESDRFSAERMHVLSERKFLFLKKFQSVMQRSARARFIAGVAVSGSIGALTGGLGGAALAVGARGAGFVGGAVGGIGMGKLAEKLMENKKITKGVGRHIQLF